MARPDIYTIAIQPPIGGIHRSFGFQKQPPYTAVDIMNMWPFNPLDGRSVLATRPPLAAFDCPAVGVNMFSPVTSGGAKPQEGLVLATASDLYYWDGDEWIISGGAQASDVSTGRAVFATPHTKYVVILNDTDPLVYDYLANTCVTMVATAGTIPTGCRVAATHLGSVMMAGTSGSESVIFSSRSGDPFDWDYTQTDDNAAFSTDIEFSGLVNGPISALASLADDQLIIGCPNEIYIMRGHLSRDGLIDPISRSIGILGQGAWCKTAEGSVYFMSKGGLGIIQSSGNAAALISDNKMPDQLRGIEYDYDDPKISMAYDPRWDVIYIAVRGNQAQAWMYHIKSGGFFRMRFASYPTVMYSHDPFMSFNRSGVLWGGDGYGGLARFDRLGVEESQPAYWAFIGPIPLAEHPGLKGKIVKARAVLGADSNDPNGVFAMYVGTDGEDAFVRAFNNLSYHRYAILHESIQINGGTFLPSLSGYALMLVISGQADKATVFEEAVLEVRPAGKNRDLRVIGYGYDFSGGIDDYDPGIGGGYNAKYGDDSKPKYGDDVAIGDPEDGGDDDGEEKWGSDTPPWSIIPIVPVTPPPTPRYATFSLASNPAGTLTDFTHFIPLSLITDDTWWSKVKSNGGDIRATTTSNVVIAMDVIAINKVARTGCVAIKLTQSGSADIRLWVGTGYLSQPTPAATTGRFNAYDSSFKHFWPTSFGVSRTSTQKRISVLSGTTPTSVSGLLSLSSRQYSGLNNYSTSVLTASMPLTAVCYGYFDISAHGFMILDTDTTPYAAAAFPATEFELDVYGNEVRARSFYDPTSGGGDNQLEEVIRNITMMLNTWHQFNGVFSASNSRQAGFNGTYTSDTASVTASTTSRLMLGTYDSAITRLAFSQVHSAARSQDWLTTQYNMIVNSGTFWDMPTYTSADWPN